MTDIAEAPDTSARPSLRDRLTPHWKRPIIAIPFVWLALFFLVPFLIVLKISFADSQVALPPYTDLWSWADDGALQIRLNFANYHYFIDDPLYLLAYLNSLKIAAISTVLCLICAYPMALAIARSSPTSRSVFLMLVILPFWTSFVLRIYAWMGLLGRNGLFNDILMGLGLTDQPITMMNTDFAVYLGIVYSYLPFMVLPIYVTLEKMDNSLMEAASDLGSRPWEVFRDITLPLSLPGVIAGCLLVFIPATGEYVIPALLGSPGSPMIGRVLFDEFYSNHDWPVASAVAVVLVLILVIPILYFQRAQMNQVEGGR
jgi:putrescine transport system permease protein